MALLPFGSAPGKMTIGKPVVSGSTGSILFVDASGNLAQSNAFLKWDITNSRVSSNGFITPVDSYYYLTNTSAVAITGFGLNSNNDIHFFPNANDTGRAVNHIYFLFNAPASSTFGGACCGGSLPTDISFNMSSFIAFQINGTSILLVTGTGQVMVGNAQQTSFNSAGLLEKYNNINTAGWGHPAIYGSGRATAQAAANNSVAAYTVGGSDGSFIISANVLVTTATLHNFTVICTYTDEGNTARTLTFTFSNVGGTLATAIANAGGAVPYEGIPLHIRAKASTAITIKTTGTFTTVAYNVEGAIQQIA